MHHTESNRRLLLLSLIVSSLILLTAGSIISPSVDKHELNPLRHIGTSPSSVTLQPSPNYESLEKRVFRTHSYLGGGFYKMMEAYSQFSPAPTASAFLTIFYQSIVNNLSPGGQWSTLPQWKSFVIGYGSMRVDFHSTIGLIPWPVVIDFAQIMLSNSKRGFAGGYRFTYYHMPTGGAITVWLTLNGFPIAPPPPPPS